LEIGAGISSLSKGDLTIAWQFTAGLRFDISQVPEGRLNRSNASLVVIARPSLRDLMPLIDDYPTLERVGYSQISLRETADE